MVTEIEHALALLAAKGYRVTEPRELDPRPVECAVCGEDDIAELTDYRVIVADGEEGYQNILQWRCIADGDDLVNALATEGFVTHEHGGSARLEDPECPGCDHPGQCSRPTVFGEVVRTHGGFWQSREVREASE